MTIDTTKPLEVVNTETGERVRCTLRAEQVDDRWIDVRRDDQKGETLYWPDGNHRSGCSVWRLRNVPEPEAEEEWQPLHRSSPSKELVELRAFKAQALAARFDPVIHKMRGIFAQIRETFSAGPEGGYARSDAIAKGNGDNYWEAKAVLLALASQSPTKDNGNE